LAMPSTRGAVGGNQIVENSDEASGRRILSSSSLRYQRNRLSTETDAAFSVLEGTAEPEAKSIIRQTSLRRARQA
jgi:hypothetical protein